MGWNQCDQMLEKTIPSYLKVTQKVAKAVFTQLQLFSKIAQKVIKYFDYICNKTCCQELTKIAQSGRTGLGTCKRGIFV